MNIEEKGRAFLRSALKPEAGDPGYVTVSFAVGCLLDRIERIELELMSMKASPRHGIRGGGED